MALIYPNLQIKGVVDGKVRELVTRLTTHAISALQSIGGDADAWVNNKGIYHFNPLETGADVTKITIDLSALNGFEKFTGSVKFKDADLTAVIVESEEWSRGIGYPLAKARAGLFGSFPNQGSALVQQARRMVPRIVADVLKQGKEKAVGYDKKPLFATDHPTDPLDPDSDPQSNLITNAGKFDKELYKAVRLAMRQFKGVDHEQESLGMYVTDVLGPSHMEDPFEEVIGPKKATLASGETNVLQNACRQWIVPQLDNDPYLQANPGKELWFAVCTAFVDVSPVEVVGTDNLAPEIAILGEGSEYAVTHRKVGVAGHMSANAAAGFWQTIIRVEET